MENLNLGERQTECQKQFSAGQKAFISIRNFCDTQQGVTIDQIVDKSAIEFYSQGHDFSTATMKLVHSISRVRICICIAFAGITQNWSRLVEEPRSLISGLNLINKTIETLAVYRNDEILSEQLMSVFKNATIGGKVSYIDLAFNILESSVDVLKQEIIRRAAKYK